CKDRELAHQDTCSITNSLLRIDDSIGLDIHNELIQISTLFNTGAVNLITHLADWAERSVDHDEAQRTVFICRLLACRNWLITTTHFNLGFKVQLTALGQMCDHMIRIYNLDIMAGFKITSGHNTFTRLTQR